MDKENKQKKKKIGSKDPSTPTDLGDSYLEKKARSVKTTLNLEPTVPQEPLVSTSSLGESTPWLSHKTSAISHLFFCQNGFLVVNGVDYTDMPFM